MTQDFSSRGAVASGSEKSGDEADRAVELNKRGRDSSILLKGGCVLTLDPQVGDFVKADVLIRGSKIAAVAPNIDADAEIIDATDTIVMPGFVDSHRHCWQGMFRRFAPNATVVAYGRDINKIGDVIRPEDVYIGNLSSCVSALDTGVTTLLDWSHISNTPAHSDAAIEGLRASGMRAVYAFGQSRNLFPGSKYPSDLRRIKQEYFASDDQLLTLYLGANIDRSDNWALARELGVPITCHVFPLWVSYTPELKPASKNSAELIKWIHAQGRLGPDVTFIHCTGLDNEAWRLIADCGATLSLTPPSVAQGGIGAGISPIQAALDHGMRPSISLDVEVSRSGDFFTLMRISFAIQRALANEARINGVENAPKLIKVRDVLEFATVQGARANNLLHKTGTLTPGKEADIIMIRTDDLNTVPFNNAIGTVVLSADRSNIDSVFVAGRIMKRQGKMVGIDVASIKQKVTASRDWLAEHSGLPVDLLGDGYGVQEEFY